MTSSRWHLRMLRVLAVQIKSKVYAFLVTMIWGLIALGLFACHAPKGQFDSDSAAPTPSKIAVEPSANPIVYSETELLRGSVVIHNEELKSRCPAVLVSRQIMILPHTCLISDSKIYSLQFTDPKSRQIAEVVTQLAPIAVNPVSQTRGSYQPRDFFLVYEIKEAVPPWVQPIPLLPSAQVSRAFENKKSLLLLFADGVRTIKTQDVRVERYFIFPYLPQNIPSENLLLTSLNGRLYLAGGAKQVNDELFWVNLTSFTLIQELLSNP